MPLERRIVRRDLKPREADGVPARETGPEKRIFALEVLIVRLKETVPDPNWRKAPAELIVPTAVEVSVPPAGMVIVIADVEERLRQSFAFTHAFFEQRDPYKRHQRFHYNAAALSLGFRRFTRDTTPRNSYTMNMSRTDRPLVVYPQPRLIGRDDIANPADEITRIVALLERSDRA